MKRGDSVPCKGPIGIDFFLCRYMSRKEKPTFPPLFKVVNPSYYIPMESSECQLVDYKFYFKIMCTRRRETKDPIQVTEVNFTCTRIELKFISWLYLGRPKSELNLNMPKYHISMKTRSDPTHITSYHFKCA